MSMLFAQLTHAIGLNDVCDALRLHSGECLFSRIRLVALWDSIKSHWRKIPSMNREILKPIPPTATRKPASLQDHRSRFESLWEESEPKSKSDEG